MTSPFDDENASYLVLSNSEEQHSLWPASLEVPAGWLRRHGPDGRAACLAYIETHWVDMRPRSLIAAMRDADA